MMDISFHYPPELLQLLIDTIPRLCKSKRDLLLFFQGAGVAKASLAHYEALLQSDKEAFVKFQVARELLQKINEQGEKSLRVRRELLKRVTEFQDFELCWENDRAAARGYVAQVRQIINVKDAFTRMQNEKDDERRRRLEQAERERAESEQARKKREEAKQKFYALFAEQDEHKRGKALEFALNNLFACHGILVREAFTLRTTAEGVVEQIDGLIELDGHVYLVEMKWWKSAIGKGDVATHLVRIYNRGGQPRGLFISYTPFTPAAIAECRDALAGGAVVMLATLEELVGHLEGDKDLKEWIRAKARAAIADKQPFSKVP